jgi:hypothetical protein
MQNCADKSGYHKSATETESHLKSRTNAMLCAQLSRERLGGSDRFPGAPPVNPRELSNFWTLRWRRGRSGIRGRTEESSGTKVRVGRVRAAADSAARLGAGELSTIEPHGSYKAQVCRGGFGRRWNRRLIIIMVVMPVGGWTSD